MIKAMLITEKNEPRAQELLRVNEITQYHLVNTFWILWDDTHLPITAWILPSNIFSQMYDIVEHRTDYQIVERI